MPAPDKTTILLARITAEATAASCWRVDVPESGAGQTVITMEEEDRTPFEAVMVDAKLELKSPPR